MGTWGIKNFENDGASDFALEIIEQGLTPIKLALIKINNLSLNCYIEAPECEEALVSAEFIAASKGKPSTDCTDELKAWAKQNKVKTFKQGLFKQKLDATQIAISVVKRIIAKSELRELWEESGEFEAWLAVQEDLLERIK